MSDSVRFEYTGEQLLRVKHVIFGNQKQANVTNAAVVKIIANGIMRNTNGEGKLDTEADVIQSIQRILEDAISRSDALTENGEEFVMLVAGEQSLANLKLDGPKYVSAAPASPESPKYNFRIYMLGEEATPDMSGEYTPADATSAVVGIDDSFDRNDIVASTEALKNKIIATAPQSVIDEFKNDYAAALYLYPAYAKFND